LTERNTSDSLTISKKMEGEKVMTKRHIRVTTQFYSSLSVAV